MAKRCDLCGKGPVAGKVYARRGKARREGGAGRKITGVSRRRFLPNLQSARILVGGRIRKIRVCTKCIKKGAFVRASRPAAAAGIPTRPSADPSGAFSSQTSAAAP